jgi:CheY-like chemotaxis protein
MVLYIEDNVVNQRLVERVLDKRSDVRLICATHAAQGLELACSQPPDLILVDVSLPDMSGETVVQYIAADQRLRHIPVIVLSSVDEDDVKKRMLAQGARAYIVKPLVLGDLLKIVEECWGPDTPSY